MHRSRHQILLRVAETAGLGLLCLDALLLFVVYTPLGNMIASAQQTYSATRQRVRNEQVRVERLQKFQTALPEGSKRLEEFTGKHIPPRKRGFSQAAHMIQQAAEASGVRITSVGYRLDAPHHDPLERLGLEINVLGSYPGLLKFTHALETGSEFLLINEFNIAAVEGGPLGMRLIAGLYMTP